MCHSVEELPVDRCNSGSNIDRLVENDDDLSLGAEGTSQHLTLSYNAIRNLAPKVCTNETFPSFHTFKRHLKTHLFN